MVYKINFQRNVNTSYKILKDTSQRQLIELTRKIWMFMPIFHMREIWTLKLVGV